MNPTLQSHAQQRKLGIQPFARPCSLAVQFVDALTGQDPIERPSIVLEREQAPGSFVTVRIAPAVTPRGILAWYALEHRRSAVGLAPVSYRLRVVSEPYIPAYRETADFQAISIAPYDDLTVPAVPPSAPLLIKLYPSYAYRFEPITPVVHGVVLSGAGWPVQDALVTEATNAVVLSDSQGRFSLPVGHLSSGQKKRIEAKDRLGRTGSAAISLPDSLYQSVAITVTQSQSQPRRTRNPHA